MLNKRINQIIEELKGSAIIVLKGVKGDELPTEKKYFSFNIENYDLFDIKDIADDIEDTIIDNRRFKDDYKWMTIEEYQIFKDYAKLNKMPIAMLENNIYSKKYPYEGTLSDVKSIYEKLYNDEETELNEEESEQLRKVSSYYGQIDYSKESDSYYVTYVGQGDDVKEFFLYDNIKSSVHFQDNYQITNEIEVELSANELPFLDMEKNIMSNASGAKVVFTVSRALSDIPNKYLERINILKQVCDLEPIFVKKSIKRHSIKNEGAYLKILHECYNHNEFKDLDFYEDITSQSKSTVKISQAQIIDDIVTQSEKALNNEPFKDIFVTASTGAGKSIMFQIPAIYLAEKYKEDRPLTLVISPLKGLMKDQVQNMHKKGLAVSETINGDITPNKKAEIIKQVKDREIDMLYLSPEMLQATGDIKLIIGERKIASVIVDEAHIATTWGKTFRADYWYLGIYLAKLRKNYSFPIITFTATAIYGGPEDMYKDTIESLNMGTPISYFGKVRRNNILMMVQSVSKEKGNDHLKDKTELTIMFLKRAFERKEKTLVYFSTVRSLNEFYSALNINEPKIAEITEKYNGQMEAYDRDETVRKFKSGETLIVLATTAFGMGIDIPDIKNVYHYSLTGGIVNYVQEIGRAARDKDKVPCGVGAIDYIPGDFNDMNALFQMSRIKRDHLLDVMEKILDLYNQKGCNRNMVVSPDDFAYIFNENIRDDSDLENKVKIAMLMIEKDFQLNKGLNYPPFVSRPKVVRGSELIFVTEEFAKELLASEFAPFVKERHLIDSDRYADVFSIDISGIWEKYYSNYSFPQFKRALYVQEERIKLKHSRIFDKFKFSVGLEVYIDEEHDKVGAISEYTNIIEAYEEYINYCKMKNFQFTLDDLALYLKKTLKISEDDKARAVSQALINASLSLSRIKTLSFIGERNVASTGVVKYRVFKDSGLFTKHVMKEIRDMLYPKNNCFDCETSCTSYFYKGGKDDKENLECKLQILGIGEAAGVLRSQVIGGDNPLIYIRMNSTYQLEKAINKGKYYSNGITKDIYERHTASVAFLNYLFTHKVKASNKENELRTYTNWFWNRVEEYFMGVSLDDMKESDK